VVQLSRHEQRELKRQQKRQQPQEQNHSQNQAQTEVHAEKPYHVVTVTISNVQIAHIATVTKVY
jgi:hypothetical protein